METNIHHIINIRSGQSTEFHDHLGNAFIPDIKEMHEMIHQAVWGIEFEDGYVFAQLGISNNRDLTKDEYKKRSHGLRHTEREMYLHNVEQGYEMDASGDCYEPDLNPGGGPYHLEN